MIAEIYCKVFNFLIIKIMKVDFNKMIKTYKGEDMIDSSTNKPLSMRDFLCGCLFLYQDSTTPDEKYMAWKLLNKINVPGRVDITVEEAALIKKASSPRSQAGIFGQIVDTIEGKEDVCK